MTIGWTLRSTGEPVELEDMLLCLLLFHLLLLLSFSPRLSHLLSRACSQTAFYEISPFNCHSQNKNGKPKNSRAVLGQKNTENRTAHGASGANKQKTSKRTSEALRVQSHAWARHRHRHRRRQRQFPAPNHAPLGTPWPRLPFSNAITKILLVF